MSASKNKIRGIVLLVDDEWLLRWSLEKALVKQNYDVIAVGSGNEALNVLTSCPALDWLITDLRMPDIDGFELIDRVKIAQPQAQLVLMTAFGSSEVERRANSLGVKYLMKPFDLNHLIEDVLNTES